MEKDLKENIVENTLLLSELLKELEDKNAKLKIFFQIYDNFQILKKLISKTEFEKIFGETEKDIQKIIDRLTSPEFLNSLISINSRK